MMVIFAAIIAPQLQMTNYIITILKNIQIKKQFFDLPAAYWWPDAMYIYIVQFRVA